jgi:peptidoglycan hydrolase-like protein with peptidoglycan-binding domain
MLVIALALVFPAIARAQNDYLKSARTQNDYMKSETVILLVEYQLSDLGYDPGEIDGVFDAAARIAVLAFEKAQGLPQDGFITDPLLNRLDQLLALRKADDDAIAARADAGPLWNIGIDPDGTKVRGVKRGSIRRRIPAHEGGRRDPEVRWRGGQDPRPPGRALRRRLQSGERAGHVAREPRRHRDRAHGRAWPFLRRQRNAHAR